MEGGILIDVLLERCLFVLMLVASSCRRSWEDSKRSSGSPVVLVFDIVATARTSSFSRLWKVLADFDEDEQGVYLENFVFEHDRREKFLFTLLGKALLSGAQMDLQFYNLSTLGARMSDPDDRAVDFARSNQSLCCVLFWSRFIAISERAFMIAENFAESRGKNCLTHFQYLVREESQHFQDYLDHRRQEYRILTLVDEFGKRDEFDHLRSHIRKVCEKEWKMCRSGVGHSLTKRKEFKDEIQSVRPSNYPRPKFCFLLYRGDGEPEANNLLGFIVGDAGQGVINYACCNVTIDLFEPETDQIVFIHWLFIVPGERGRGFGKMLVKKTLNVFRVQMRKKRFWLVLEFNSEKARVFWGEQMKMQPLEKVGTGRPNMMYRCLDPLESNDGVRWGDDLESPPMSDEESGE